MTRVELGHKIVYYGSKLPDSVTPEVFQIQAESRRALMTKIFGLADLGFNVQKNFVSLREYLEVHFYIDFETDEDAILFKLEHMG